MLPLISRNIWDWIEENRSSFEPPVGNKVIWEDSQFTAMIIRGPNARRDFHIDPSDEIFYMLKGNMDLEYVDAAGKRQHAVIREGDLLLTPGNVPHSPHRPADTWGLVIERKRGPEDQESVVWYCERCDAELDRITISALDIEQQLKGVLLDFDADEARRTCKRCGHVQPEKPTPVPAIP